jgi:hypothetical protein
MPSDRADFYIIYRIERAFRTSGVLGASARLVIVGIVGSEARLVTRT